MKSRSKNGFTIIEVVLVLAIAGLIFIMAFVGFPALQRSQRDAQRRQDVDRFYSSLSQYLINSKALPGETVSGITISYSELESATSGWGKLARVYILANGNDTFIDPSGEPYVLAAKSCTSQDDCVVAETQFDVSSPTITVLRGAICGGADNKFEYNGSPRAFALSMRLESNGYYCIDNG